MSHIAHRLVEDTAWHPAGKAELEKWGTVQRTLFKIFLGSPLKLWASVGHWALWHFDLSLYTDKQKPRVRPHSAWPCTLLCRHADPPLKLCAHLFHTWQTVPGVHTASGVFRAQASRHAIGGEAHRGGSFTQECTSP